MSLLRYYTGTKKDDGLSAMERHDMLYERDALGDLKHGLDMIFELKKELDKMHPVASQTLVGMLSHP